MVVISYLQMVDAERLSNFDTYLDVPLEVGINVSKWKTNKSHLKMDGWNTIASFRGPAYFKGKLLVSSHKSQVNPINP